MGSVFLRKLNLVQQLQQRNSWSNRRQFGLAQMEALEENTLKVVVTSIAGHALPCSPSSLPEVAVGGASVMVDSTQSI